MRRSRWPTILAAMILLGCRMGVYDWAPTEAALTRLLPAGLPSERALVILDSMGFRHSPPSATDTVLYASKREPHPYGLVFSTLQVVVTIAPDRTIRRLASHVMFTGP